MAVKKVEKTEKTVKASKKAKTTKPKTEKIVEISKEAKKEKVLKVTKVTKVVDVAKNEISDKESKIVPKEVIHKNIAKIIKNEKYFYAVGRRKTSIAQVRLFNNDKATDNDLIVNGKKFKEYFPTVSLQNNFLSPLKAVGMQGKVGMTIKISGGGITGQVEAARLGISRALILFDKTLKKTLKDLGLTTRDSRKVERKKAGLKKARKAPQWSKR
jgi:small subunit ribosomal protein S9